MRKSPPEAMKTGRASPRKAGQLPLRPERSPVDAAKAGRKGAPPVGKGRK